MANNNNKPNKRINSKLRMIAEIAVTLFVEKGYWQTTAKDVAEACNMGVGTLYHYIKSKDNFPALFGQILKEEFQVFETKIRNEFNRFPPDELMNRTVKEYIHWCDNRRKIIIFWYDIYIYAKREQLKAALDVENGVIHIFQEIIDTGCQAGIFHTKDSIMTAHAILEVCNSWALKQWRLRRIYTLKQFTKSCQQRALSMAYGQGEVRIKTIV
jgi:TetR/AcrR family transcriptional regulator, cholesterol catabolism regulator